MISACVFSLDDAFVMPFQVFFHSLERTESIPAGTSIFILHTDALSQESIANLQPFLARYGREATFLDASHLIPADLPIREGDHVSPATFYRLFIAEILPRGIDQAVYLDVDMIALQSISELFRVEVKALIGAADHLRPDNSVRLWGELAGDYFQAGVLVIPLQVWRRINMVNRFLDILENHASSILWWDQDVLNLATADDWQRLPIWINATPDVQALVAKSSLMASVRLAHFTGSRKPWTCFNAGPFTADWDRAYHEVFGCEFNRNQFKPPVSMRVIHALKSRISGLIHGRYAPLINLP